MNQTKPEGSKSSLLVFTLLTVMCLGVIVALNVVTFGIFFWVIAITFAIAMVGSLHYLLWGQDLSDQVAEEREAFLRQQTRERERDEGWRE